MTLIVGSSLPKLQSDRMPVCSLVWPLLIIEIGA
jgi:hypothetical protein